jgi:protein ImuB
VKEAAVFVPQWLTVSDRAVGQMFGAIYAAEGSDPAVLSAVAREFSPRIELLGQREITLDLSGLSTLFGDARAIGEELRRTAADRGLKTRIAIAGTRTAARLMVRHRAGLSVIEPGTEANVLAPMPVSLIDDFATIHQPPLTTNRKPPTTTHHQPPTTILKRWGLRTLGELVALPPDEVMARLGAPGIDWQRMARGEDQRPLVPSVPEERFEQSLELEWPIEGLEPLSFILGRLMEPLSTHLQLRDRGAAVLHVRLRLVTKQDGVRLVHARSLELPAPMREAKTLRTLALLDLDAHPPSAAIDAVTVAVDPTPARVVQYSLLTRPLPTPEQLSTLTARLHALMGEARCGSPRAVDFWKPGAFEMKPFAPSERDTPRRRGTEVDGVYDTVRYRGSEGALVTSLRRFRRPVPARVQVDSGKPSRIVIDRRGFKGGAVADSAGPWRTSGAWWTEEKRNLIASAPPCVVKSDQRKSESQWDRDEWDILLADGTTYRLFRERAGNHWFVDGVVD